MGVVLYMDFGDHEAQLKSLLDKALPALQNSPVLEAADVEHLLARLRVGAHHRVLGGVVLALALARTGLLRFLRRVMQHLDLAAVLGEHADRGLVHLGEELIGEAAGAFADALAGTVALDLCKDMESAIAGAGEMALADKLPGATVLLSPACACAVAPIFCGVWLHVGYTSASSFSESIIASTAVRNRARIVSRAWHPGADSGGVPRRAAALTPCRRYPFGRW